MPVRKPKKSTRKVGRPKIQIDYETCEKLASIFCTQSEIAAFIDVSLSTLDHDKEFLRIHRKGIEIAKMSLRRKQFKLADKSAGMAIFLGKNYLGQRDTQEFDIGENVQEYFKKIADAIEGSDTSPA